MTRLGLMVGIAICATACQMPNPAFDEQETDGLAHTEEVGDGDGDPTGEPSETGTTTGDGDGEPATTGDGDGEPATTGDGDGEPATTGDGDGDPLTTGDGDGDPMVEECPNFLTPANDCQQCAANFCCEPGIEECFQAGTDCSCLLNCTKGMNKTLAECMFVCQSGLAASQLVETFGPCMDLNCGDLCG